MSPRRLILALLGIALVAGTLLWWKGQARDRARERLISEFGAMIEPEAEINGGGWSAIVSHESLTDLSTIAPLLVQAGPVRLLDLSNCPNLASFRGLSAVESIETLIAIECPKLSSVDGIDGLPKLRELAIPDNPALASLDGLARLPALEILDVSRCPQLKQVSTRSLPKVLSVSLADCENLMAVDVTGSPDLTSLMLDNCRSLTEIAGLEKLRSLTDLIVSGGQGVRSLAGLAELSSLVKLDLRNTPAAAAHLTDIGRLSSLEVLILGGLPELTNLGVLGGLSRLNELQIEACEGLTSLSGMPSSLTSYVGITHCPNLASLAGIEAAAGLERLDLTGNAGLTDLTPLGGLEHLRELNLAACRGITDTAVFAQMPNLSIVQLGGSGVPAAHLAQLRKSHPETVFDFTIP